MADLTFRKYDETYVRIEADQYIIRELKEYLSFFSKGYKWDKRYKAGYWDGKISLINATTRLVYKGLIPHIIDYLERGNVPYEIEDGVITSLPPKGEFTREHINKIYEKFNSPYEPLESQIKALIDCLNTGRNIPLAPTANGKSYIMHGLNLYYYLIKKRVLIVIDRSQLVLQLKENFIEEYNAPYTVDTIYDNKNSDADVVVTTWQSVYKNPEKWFQQFDVIVGDEVHRFKAKCIKEMFDKCGHIVYRHGLTATLDNDSECDALVLIGLFGPPIQVATMRELIDQGIIADPTIYAILISYKDESISRDLAKIPIEERYQHECRLLEALEARTKFIRDLNQKLKGNTIIAFKNREHGKNILEAVKEIYDGDIFFADGTVSKDERFKMSQIIDTLDHSTAVVSTGTTSTGVNIKNLNNLIISCALKSIITIKQLIGRTLRITETKKTSSIYDLGDDLTHEGVPNITLTHFMERMKVYRKEKLRIKLIKIRL